MTSVSWSDLQKAAGEAGFDPLPPSTYDVVVDSAQVKASTSGKNMIAVKFKVENGPHQGKSVFNQFVISPDSSNALAFFFRHMSALGLNEAYFAANPPLERVAADLTGRRCQIKVSIRQWQGTDRNQVDAVAPAAGSPAPVVSAGLPGVIGAGAAPAPAIPSSAPAAPASAIPSAAAAPAVTPPPPPIPSPPPVPEPVSVPAAAIPIPTPVAAPPPPPGMSNDDLPF